MQNTKKKSLGLLAFKVLCLVHVENAIAETPLERHQ